jgi:Universal stress protein family
MARRARAPCLSHLAAPVSLVDRLSARLGLLACRFEASVPVQDAGSYGLAASFAAANAKSEVVQAVPDRVPKALPARRWSATKIEMGPPTDGRSGRAQERCGGRKENDMGGSIVCGVDGSADSQAALGVAARLAERLEARLVLAHVAELALVPYAAVGRIGPRSRTSVDDACHARRAGASRRATAPATRCQARSRRRRAESGRRPSGGTARRPGRRRGRRN